METKETKLEEINRQIREELSSCAGQVSDGYHTFDELYDFRRAYNAALVNTNLYRCHKSHRHSDGELCFGGGWFIVIMELPTGQISNHYENKYWDEFDCEIRERADKWDGHTDKDVLERLKALKGLKSLETEIAKACQEEFEAHTSYSVYEIKEWREKNGYPPLL